jgi:hypothetical protein
MFGKRSTGAMWPTSSGFSWSGSRSNIFRRCGNIRSITVFPKKCWTNWTDPIVLMHPGPINRGVELTSDAADSSPFSIILDQVENGVAVRMAVLYLLAQM